MVEKVACLRIPCVVTFGDHACDNVLDLTPCVHFVGFWRTSLRIAFLRITLARVDLIELCPLLEARENSSYLSEIDRSKFV